MREIKFRFWHKNDKCFFSPSSLGWKFDPVNGQLYVNGLNVTDRVEIMQYTGLKDKNGKEIYEGDIDGNYDDGYRFVTYHAGTYGLQYINDPITFDPFILWEECEIIGNKWDNPELLK